MRKSILKRDAYSFEEYSRQGLLACPDRGILDRKAKSFEEREQEYEKAKRRIFKDSNSESLEFWNSWSNSNSSELVRTNSSAATNNDRDDDNNNSYNTNTNTGSNKTRMSRASVSERTSHHLLDFLCFVFALKKDASCFWINWSHFPIRRTNRDRMADRKADQTLTNIRKIAWDAVIP